MPLLALLLLALVTLIWQRPALQRSMARTARATLAWLDVTPRSLYVLRLQLAGLDDTVAGQRWLGAMERAGEQPVIIDDGGYFEQGRFDGISARVYQLSLERGERLEIALSRRGDSDAQLFAALYRRDGPNDDWQTILPIGHDGVTAITATDDASYRLTLQPELLAQVEYALDIAVGGSLPFPVQGAAPRAIGSVFGDPRDGGVREHHGVDIFADRGTPVRAVVDGRVRTDTGGLGGKHIWLSGDALGLFGASYYYAHLDSFAVDNGETVAAGEIIGTVGNTGNARTTPPHLHFGIYTSDAGPVDPEPFIQPPPDLG